MKQEINSKALEVNLSETQKIKVEIEMENTTFVDSTHFVVITDEY